MKVIPKVVDDELVVAPGVGGALRVLCVATEPRAMVGRQCVLEIPGPHVAAMLRYLRTAASEARR